MISLEGRGDSEPALGLSGSWRKSCRKMEGREGIRCRGAKGTGAWVVSEVWGPRKRLRVRPPARGRNEAGSQGKPSARPALRVPGAGGCPGGAGCAPGPRAQPARRRPSAAELQRAAGALLGLSSSLWEAPGGRPPWRLSWGSGGGAGAICVFRTLRHTARCDRHGEAPEHGTLGLRGTPTGTGFLWRAPALAP